LRTSSLPLKQPANFTNSQQPWSTYALHIATFTSLSFVFDPLIIFLAIRAAPGSGLSPYQAVVAQLIFMAWIKVIKLVGLFRREPMDIIFLPISILFGYFHGLIKLWALATLRVVSHVPLLFSPTIH
jgi:hypothetical protein